MGRVWTGLGMGRVGEEREEVVGDKYMGCENWGSDGEGSVGAVYGVCTEGAGGGVSK